MNFLQFIKNGNMLDLTGQYQLQNNDFNTKEITEFVEQNTNITHLSLAKCFTYGNSISMIYNCHELNFSNIDLLSDILNQKIEISNLLDAIGKGKLQNINYFDFSNNNIDKDICLIIDQITKHTSNLQVLNLENTNIEDSYILLIKNCLLQFSNLRELNLSHNKIGDYGIKTLVSKLPNKLDTETINEATTQEVEDYNILYNNLNYFKNLEILKLGHNLIGNKAAHKLANKISALNNLQILDLDSNPIGIVGYAELAQAIKLHNPDCYALSVGDNKKITQVDLNKVYELLTREDYSKSIFDLYIKVFRRIDNNFDIADQDEKEAANSFSNFIKVTKEIAEVSQNPQTSSGILEYLHLTQSMHLLTSVIKTLIGIRSINDYTEFNNPIARGTNMGILINTGATIHDIDVSLLGQQDDEYDSSDDDDSCNVS